VVIKYYTQNDNVTEICDCSSLIYGFDYPFGIFWSLLVCSSLIYGLDYPFGIFWSLLCLFFLDIYFENISVQILWEFKLAKKLVFMWLLNITHKTTTSLKFVIFRYYHTMLLQNKLQNSKILWHIALHYPFGIFWSLLVCSSLIYGLDYPFGIFWPLLCLFFLDIRIWLPLWW
jgi:hypothetical protein